MPRLYSISNMHKQVEDKANFFSDWFHYYARNVGYCYQFELENPLSLIDKTIYQLENNQGNALAYLKNHFSNSYFLNDEYLNNFSTYSSVKNKIVELRSITKQAQFKKWIEENSNFIHLLIELRNDLYDNMFKYSLSEIISFLTCTHSVNKHIEEIKFNVKIFVTEYILRNRSRDDLTEIFRSILSKDIKIFPFPQNIKTTEEKQNFLKNMKLDEQFEGLANLLDIPQNSWNFYIKVYGIELEAGIKFTYDRITFYSNQHVDLKKARDEKSFFFEDGHKYFIAAVKVYYFSHKIALEEAREIIKKELVYLCLLLKRDLSVDNTNNYLTSDDGEKFYEAWSSERYSRSFGEEILIDFADTPFSFLKDYSNEAQKQLLRFEHLFLNARKQSSMPDYWHYLEVLLQLKDDERKSAKIIDIVSTITIIQEKKIRKRLLFNTLNASFMRFDFPYDKLNLTDEEVKEFQKSFELRKIPKKLFDIDYPFLQELLKDYKQENASKFHKTARAYYASILTEAYEQRNFYQHQAISNQKSIIKLHHTLPWIIQRFRWGLFDEIKKHDSISFTQAIENLRKKGVQLCK